MKIGVSGGPASFSEEAAEYYVHKNKIKNYKIIYLISVERVLRAIDSGKIDLGVFPIENSNGGIVYEAVYAMSRHLFKIKKLFEIDIRHCLIALPNKKLSDISMIASHDQALKQCKMYLKRRWAEIEIKEWCDTAEAVKSIKSGKLMANCAAIAPRKAAELYEMKILDESIQDLKFNFTTFLAVEAKKS